MTPNSSVFGHCVNLGLIRLKEFRLRRHSSIRRGPRTKHVRGLLQRRNMLDSLCWRVLHCVSNQPVHIWLPKSVARKNNHGLTRNPREPSDWQAVEGKTLSSPRGRTAGRTTARTTDLLSQQTMGSPRKGTAGGTAAGTPAHGTDLLGLQSICSLEKYSRTLQLTSCWGKKKPHGKKQIPWQTKDGIFAVFLPKECCIF